MICNVIVTVWEKAEKVYKHRWRNLGELFLKVDLWVWRNWPPRNPKHFENPKSKHPLKSI